MSRSIKYIGSVIYVFVELLFSYRQKNMTFVNRLQDYQGRQNAEQHIKTSA